MKLTFERMNRFANVVRISHASRNRTNGLTLREPTVSSYDPFLPALRVDATSVGALVISLIIEITIEQTVERDTLALAAVFWVKTKPIERAIRADH